ncbi:MAG: hypothetical protein ABI553_00040 [Chloroflexota bacterium]
MPAISLVPSTVVEVWNDPEIRVRLAEFAGCAYCATSRLELPALPLATSNELGLAVAVQIGAILVDRLRSMPIQLPTAILAAGDQVTGG